MWLHFVFEVCVGLGLQTVSSAEDCSLQAVYSVALEMKTWMGLLTLTHYMLNILILSMEDSVLSFSHASLG